MKKALKFAGLMKYINLKDPRIKSLGVVAMVAAFALFGLAAVVLAVGALAIFQLASNTNIALDINQLLGTVQSWVAGILGIGQGILEDLQQLLGGASSEA